MSTDRVHRGHGVRGPDPAATTRQTSARSISPVTHRQQARALHIEQAHFETLFDNAPDAIVVLDGSDRVLRTNAAFGRLFGYTPSEAHGRYINDLIVPPTRREEGTALSARAYAGELDHVETRRQRKDGTEVDVAITVTPVEVDGCRLGVHATYRDITEQKHRVREREHTVSMLAATLEATADGLLVIDRAGDRVECLNHRFAEMLHLPESSLPSLTPKALRRHVVSQLRNPTVFLTELHRMFEHPDREGVCQLIFKDGRMLEHYVRPQKIADRVVGHVMSLRDVTERSRADRAQRVLTEQLNAANHDLQRLVDYDPLTQSLNRRGVERVLAVEQARVRRDGTPLLALLLDCDDFKRINDELGYQVGDAMLREVAAAIHSAIRPTDHAGRLGGDEFLVLLPELGYWDGMRIGERIRLAVTRRTRTLSESIALTVSAGICAVPPAPASLEEILALAYVALRMGKGAGKNLVFSEGRQADADAESPANQLANAACYRVAIQPIMRLADDTVVGHELLSRTTIEAFESPDHLFPLAQQHNMLTFVDLLCLDTCLAEAHKFSPSGFYHVNLFPSTVMNTSIERLVSALGALTPSQVCLEITEQQFFGDSRQFTRRVQALRDAGFHVALDDVGFGRTSLELLMLLDVEFVKIDRRFVTGIGDDRTRAQALSRLLSVIALIGATAIVEGIETSDEQAALISLGVEYGQGFLWGRPHALGTTRST